MKKIFFIFQFFLLSGMYSNAQSDGADSCGLQVSLLTCAPGTELYSTFGHTALRVKDLAAGTDLVYNYGTFEFAPDFYMKFIRGKLLYFLSVENFAEFIAVYRQESRSVQEQLINLSCSEKQNLVDALNKNAQPENRLYRYDFLFDNCTTRAGEMVVKQAADSVGFKNILGQSQPSFRDLIHHYLDAGHEPWSKLGIDILLGAKLDRKVSNREAMFLPDYLLKGFDSAFVHGQPLVSAPQPVLQMPSPLEQASFFTPALAFLLLLVLFVALGFLRNKWARTLISLLDFLLFFSLGLTGIVLLFMWFGTDHTVCANNYNLAWALPTHLVMAFFTGSTRRWAKQYFRIVFFINLLLLIGWFFLPQAMNPALLPLCLLIFFRTLSFINPNRHAAKTVSASE